MSEELTVLLVEDNPGDARLIREMLEEETELPEHAGRADELTLHRESRLQDALEYLESADGPDAASDPADEAAEVDPPVGGGEPADDAASGDSDGADDAASDGGVGSLEQTPQRTSRGPDVVLLDLDLPDSTGLDTLAGVLEESSLLPVIVLTGLADREVGIQAIEQGAQDYLVKDDVTGDLLERSIRYAMERSRQERRRKRRREQLEALNRHNRIAQDVTHAVITSSTREELEQAVCERLVASDGYQFAWIGEVDRGHSRVTPRADAGEGSGYLDEIEITVGDDERARGPTGIAIRTHDAQVVRDASEDPQYEPWREAADEYDYRSSAAIPIVHEGLLYGVLNVYATTVDAFSDTEVEILGRLGDVVGHAISALERRDALMADTVQELEFQVEGFVPPLAQATAEHGATVSFETLVETDGAVLAYGQAEGLPRERFRAVAEETDVVQDCRVMGGSGDSYEVEVVTTAGRPLFEALSTHGGAVDSATVTDGEALVVVHFPQGRDTRRLIELVEDNCPAATLQAQRTREREEDHQPRAARDRLTEKQRTALETAYHAGHFEWPRETSGEEIAERLGVSPATFHEHLRSAERKVFEQLIEDE